MSKRYYCGRAGCAIEYENGKCPECGSPSHREIDEGVCGWFVPCVDGSPHNSENGFNRSKHGHPCELAPGHEGGHFFVAKDCDEG